MEKKLIRSFEDLTVWQKAIEFVTEVYLVTNQGELKRDFGLHDHLRERAVTISRYLFNQIRSIKSAPPRL